MGQWNTPTGGRFYIGLGPYFGMGLKAELEDSDVDLYEKIDGEAFMNKISYGAAAQIGYEWSSGLQFNAGYKVGANVLDANKDDFEMLPQSVSIGIGYRF
jgi:outer membrane protein W